jgi:hypothetical protein
MNRPRGVGSQRPGLQERAGKASGGLVCEDCGIVQRRGRWSFETPPPAQPAAGRCPACRRIHDKYPAGTLRLPAALLGRRDDVLRLIRNVEATEKAEHPLERLMAIEEAGPDLIVTTTGVHLARELAHRLGRQFHRKPHLRYADGEDLVHVDWESAQSD